MFRRVVEEPVVFCPREVRLRKSPTRCLRYQADDRCSYYKFKISFNLICNDFKNFLRFNFSEDDFQLWVCGNCSSSKSILQHLNTSRTNRLHFSDQTESSDGILHLGLVQIQWKWSWNFKFFDLTGSQQWKYVDIHSYVLNRSSISNLSLYCTRTSTKLRIKKLAWCFK